jgi:two-component system NarL family sensor kinase
MLEPFKDINLVTVTVISTVLILIFAVVVIVAIVKYKGKQGELSEQENVLRSELAKTSLEAKDEIIKNMAQRIHGDIQQTLSLAKLNLSKVLMNKEEIDIERIVQTKDLIVKTISEVKDLSKEMDPKYISGHTLEENITRQLNRVRDSANLETNFATSEVEVNTSDEVQIFVYRILQEAINNILSHSEATRINVSLQNLTGRFKLSIADNGKGFNTSDNFEKGIGLINMRNRTALINGVFTLKSKENEGTIITLIIPL